MSHDAAPESEPKYKPVYVKLNVRTDENGLAQHSLIFALETLMRKGLIEPSRGVLTYWNGFDGFATVVTVPQPNAAPVPVPATQLLISCPWVGNMATEWLRRDVQECLESQWFEPGYVTAEIVHQEDPL